jgi:hypothetical protein
MLRKKLYLLAVLILTFFLLCNFWLYSRFTVDDAFISWRYGKNLILHGIWNYNFSFFDLTQSYTNPIFAALSVPANLFNFDIVFFFKFFSIINIIIFFFWFIKKTRGSYVALLLILAMPATMVHAFSGLETFLYVSLMSVLFISLDNHKRNLSIILALILFLVRPESWILVFLIPIFFLVKKNFQFKDLISLKIKLKLNDFIITLICLSVPLMLYLFYNKIYFGYSLPTSFYVKSNITFSIQKLITFLLFVLPLLLLLLKKRIKIFLIMIVFNIIVALNYSNSDLQSNYMERFSFQIFFPIYVFIIYFSEKRRDIIKVFLNKSAILTISFNKISKLVAIIFLLFLYVISGITSAAHITSYPRMLASNAELGKVLSKIKNKYQIKSFVFGDAGMAAYHSDMNALDNIGLGSAIVAHKNKLTYEVMDLYKPDLIVFMSSPEGILTRQYSQDEMLRWANNNGLRYLCDIHFNTNSLLKLYSRFVSKELIDVCNNSKLTNDKKDRSYLYDIFKFPPWRYWTE